MHIIKKWCFGVVSESSRLVVKCGTFYKDRKVNVMNNIDIANGMVFQRLGICKDSFDDRLICQKKIYLLQSLGTNLGYMYNWYVRGPYSPALTTYIYANLDVLSRDDFSHYKLAEVVEKNIQCVNNLEKVKRADCTASSWYELLASLLYVYNNKESWKIDDQEQSLFLTLIKYKPQYNKEQCKDAFRVLKDEGFIETI